MQNYNTMQTLKKKGEEKKRIKSLIEKSKKDATDKFHIYFMI